MWNLAVGIFIETKGLRGRCTSAWGNSSDGSETTAAAATTPGTAAAVAATIGITTSNAAAVQTASVQSMANSTVDSGVAPECAQSYLMAYSALLVVCCCCVVLPYAAHLSARVTVLLQKTRLSTVLGKSAFQVSPVMAALLAIGGWLAVLAMAFFDLAMLVQTLFAVVARTCGGGFCTPDNRKKLMIELRLRRLFEGFFHCLDPALDTATADALLLQRAVAQALFSSLPCLVVCLVCAVGKPVEKLWTHGYSGDWEAADSGGAGWDFTLVQTELLVATVACAVNLFVQWARVLLDARASNASFVEFVMDSLQAKQSAGDSFPLEDHVMHRHGNLPATLVLGSPTSGEVVSLALNRVRMETGGFRLEGGRVTGVDDARCWPAGSLNRQGLSESSARHLANTIFRGGKQSMAPVHESEAHLQDRQCRILLTADACRAVSLHTLLRLHAAATHNEKIDVVFSPAVDWLASLQRSVELGFCGAAAFLSCGQGPIESGKLPEAEKWSGFTPLGVPLLEYAAMNSMKSQHRAYGSSSNDCSSRNARIRRPDSSSSDDEELGEHGGSKNNTSPDETGQDLETGGTICSHSSHNRHVFWRLFTQLLDAGADPDASLGSGQASILHFCVQNGAKEHVLALLDHGALPEGKAGAAASTNSPLGACYHVYVVSCV